jgi:bud site selection protein 20
MGTGKYRRTRTHHARKAFYRKFRTKNRPKDLDQILEDLNKHTETTNTEVLDIQQPVSLDQESQKDHETLAELPAMGQFQCIHCDRYFVDSFTLDHHIRSKVHKRRLKLLRDAPYTQKDAERATGMTH